MIKTKQSKPNIPIEIDLTGPDGNAFALLGNARRWAKDLKLNWDPIEKEATSGDYDHLVATLDKYFGEFVIFYK